MNFVAAECGGKVCSNNSLCVLRNGASQCACKAGFEGDGIAETDGGTGCSCTLMVIFSPHVNVIPIIQHVAYFCAAIFDAEPCSRVSCSVNASCDPIPELGIANCHCDEGFVGNGLECEEENPCLDSNFCDVTEECDPSRKPPCQCIDGYERSGTNNRSNYVTDKYLLCFWRLTLQHSNQDNILRFFWIM